MNKGRTFHSDYERDEFEKHIGVQLTKEGTNQESWVAEFITKEKRHRKSFSTITYGYNEAHEKALNLRVKWEVEIPKILAKNSFDSLIIKMSEQLSKEESQILILGISELKNQIKKYEEMFNNINSQMKELDL